MGSQRQGNSPDHELERNQEDERNIEGSVHCHPDEQKPFSSGQSHIPKTKQPSSHAERDRRLEKETVPCTTKAAPFSSDISSNDEEDNNYRWRLRTPPSETFSYEDEHRRRRKHKGPSSKGLGNDAMNKTLNQVSKSPFMSCPKPQRVQSMRNTSQEYLWIFFLLANQAIGDLFSILFHRIRIYNHTKISPLQVKAL